MRNLATTVQFEQVASEYAVPVQAAGLNLGIVDICRNDAATPDELRRMLTRQLQHVLPRSVPWSVRADASTMPNDEFRKTEARVREAVIAAAHQSPVLREVITRDPNGRDVTEYFGAKRNWMQQFIRAPQLMKSIGGAPVKLPVIL